MAISQKERLIRIATPLPKNTFVVKSFAGTEAISKAFRFEIKMVSKLPDITFEQMAGKKVSVGIRAKEGERNFNGAIISFSPAQISKDPGYNTYHAVMVPTFWAHTEYSDCRIFQKKTVPQIIESVLKKGTLGNVAVPNLNFEMSLSGTYTEREYCVQYNESNFDFISRLCEEEGIYFFFKHDEKDHILIFSDKPSTHESCPISLKGGAVHYRENTGGYKEEETIDLLLPNRKLTTEKYSARDHNFTIPKSDLPVDKKTQKGKATSKGEIYEYPGGYEQTDGQGNNLADIRMQAFDARIFNIHGRSNCRGFKPGYKFKLKKYSMDEMNGKEYVLLKVRHSASQSINTADRDSDSYINNFYCIPHAVPYRPARITRKPRIVSSQTAIVTGPKAEEIHTDNYGRVKVRFHWDRREEDPRNGNMSCWIRVSQSWAGNEWGGMNIPRVGQEVIVNFLDGDPDRPIITGRVYREDNMPPYKLPTHKTRSTIKSNSSKGGKNSNEICFEDKKGDEYFYTHAAKDQNEVVENDMVTEVKNNQSIKVEKDRGITVSSGNETLTIEKGGRTVSVKANENHTNSANFNQKVSANYTLKVNGNITIDATGIVKISGAKLILNG